MESPKKYIKAPRVKYLKPRPKKAPSAKGRRAKFIEPAANEKTLKGSGLKAPKKTNKKTLSFSPL